MFPARSDSSRPPPPGWSPAPGRQPTCRVRCVVAVITSTAMAAAAVAASTRSPSSNADHSRIRTGWAGARLVYCQPAFANPTGVVMPPRRRAAVLDVVRAAGAFLLEDDFARLLPLTAEPPPPMVRDDPDGHVVYVTSLTKAAAPSALIARGPAAARLRAIRTVDDLFVPAPMQEAAVELLSSAAWPRHLAALRRALTARRDALLRALAGSDLPVRVTRVPAGGLHVWLRLLDEVDDRELARACAQRGLRVTPGTPCHPGEPPGSFLRLTYSGETPERLVAGVDLFREVWAERFRRPAHGSGRMNR